MRIKNVSIAVLFFVILTSCKNEKNPDAKVEPQAEAVNENLRVTLDVTVKKDDDLQVYYVDDVTEAFSEKKSVWVAVKGSENPQKVVFNIPKDQAPHLLRLDFGVNPNQDDIVFSSIELNYFGKIRLMKGTEMEFFFRPVSPTKIDFATGIINAKDDTGKRVEPVLYSQEVPLGKELDKLIKSAK